MDNDKRYKDQQGDPHDNNSTDLGIIQMGILWCLIAHQNYAEYRILISSEACFHMNMVQIFLWYWDKKI